jgi:hypothetical protein
VLVENRLRFSTNTKYYRTENRRLPYLERYFSRFSLATREAVQLIVIDMYAPYVSLVKKAFPECSVDHRSFPHRPTYWQNFLESSSERNHGTT